MADDDNLDSNPLSQEPKTCFHDQQQQDLVLVLDSYSVSDEHIEMLLDTEITFGFTHEQSFEMGNWVKFARCNAISWILKNRAIFGFQFQTAYLSISYFDRFLSIRQIDSEKTWAIQLLSVACLSLAAKIEECKVPALPEFRFDDDFSFGSDVIQRMELMVLNTLEWRMNFVTPFSFIYYFIAKFSDHVPSNDVISRTIQLILELIKDVNLMSHRPSAIAAAAALMVLDSRLTKQALECKINAIPSCGFLETDDVCVLYDKMLKQEIDKQNAPNSIASPDLSPTRFSRPEAHESSSNTKRKRLTFNDDNDHNDEKRRQL